MKRPPFPYAGSAIAARGLVLALFVGTVAVDAAAELDLAHTYPIPDTELGEEIREGEVEAAERLIATLEKQIRTDYQPGDAKRDAHPKAHGCVAATFDVHDDIPAELEHGVFKPGASYDALIRFSNGSPNAKGKDISGDTRGMAIKLHGVEGEKLFSPPGQADVQDFILISSPFFFINAAEGYAEFFEIVNSGSTWRLLKIPFILGFRGSYHAYEMLSQQIANPLTTRYWSVVPYQLGQRDARQAVKYSAKPCEPHDNTIPENPSNNYLREAMVSTLSSGPACMEFMIQPRVGDMSVENAVIEWDEAKAPFHTVATITVHEQDFDTPAKNEACENESYNPWHALPAHKPLGMVNRLRRVVYQAISELRHKMNGVD
ncbi:MAG: catalase family protein [Gammaproteobacteria bacterium]|nr:catalase family protein [Gammaproteobacteria bacterium]